ncbi:MAG: M16 family metallopeptidase [Pyrinomonadaceae bacterium]
MRKMFVFIQNCFMFSMLVVFAAVQCAGQETLPSPGPARTVIVPAVKESKLKNGLTVAVVERRSVPLITVQLLVRNGARSESKDKAGLANITASLLTKGTKMRSATQVAEEMEFLGGSLFSFGGWQSSALGMTVTSDTFEPAMAVMADTALNPAFKQEEIDLEKSQTLDLITANMASPGFIANYVASSYSFGEHPAGGTPASIGSITRADVSQFYAANYKPKDAVLIFVGDITAERAATAAEIFFGTWGAAHSSSAVPAGDPARNAAAGNKAPFRRLLVVDLPNSGQASVNWFKPISGLGRQSSQYYAASVLNSLLGGGYSSRLNQEIRIKRGLSYGAGSNFTWRDSKSNFGARTQTKNESAAEVTELILAELKRLADTAATDAELRPRKSVLTGGFGRNLETTQGLAGALADLYSFGLSTYELNAYMTNVNNVRSADLRSFATENLYDGDIIIVGDYSVFKDDLAKRFPNVKIDVLKATDIDARKETP